VFYIRRTICGLEVFSGRRRGEMLIDKKTLSLRIYRAEFISCRMMKLRFLGFREHQFYVICNLMDGAYFVDDGSIFLLSLSKSDDYDEPNEPYLVSVIDAERRRRDHDHTRPRYNGGIMKDGYKK
jgi:hypothetical protein